MKQTIKIYLEPDEIKKLKDKALRRGFVGRGSLSHFLSKLANNDFFILDENGEVLVKALKTLIDSVPTITN